MRDIRTKRHSRCDLPNSLSLAFRLLPSLFRYGCDAAFGAATQMTMAKETTTLSAPNWRQELPPLSARLVTLREPTMADLRSLMDLLLLADASRFGIDEPLSEVAVQQMLERIASERSSGVAFTYAISVS